MKILFKTMLQVADLHIHSRFARACSKDLNLLNIEKFCQIKGVDIIATGDFTHPAWFSEIKKDLESTENGFYKIKGSNSNVSFVLATELSCIYKKGDKVRRVHICVMTPNIIGVEKLILKLEERGCNLRADGRPILGIPVDELTKICFDCDENMFVWPAHIWTPWFSMFGSKSGFNTVKECFGDMSSKIYAIETGLSSDPQMNWRVSNLDNYSIISNSDAHSLQNIAREANVFDLPNISYNSLVEAIKNKNPKTFLKTIEFYPEEGRYHFDGHRACGVKFEPKETTKNNGICPKCKLPLTIGVLNRVQELADRPENYINSNRVPFIKLIELDKIIASAFGIKSRKSKKVQAEYNLLIQNFGNELNILLNVPIVELQKYSKPIIAEGIKRVRNGEVKIECGFDGEYGKIEIFTKDELVLNKFC